MTIQKGFNVALRENTPKVGDIHIYTSVGEAFNGITSERFITELSSLGKVNTINLHINSDGGDFFQGVAIYNALVRHPAKIHTFIDGLAASIASYIAMAGSEITIGQDSWIMIHEPWGRMMGTAADFRKQADLMDKMRDGLVTTYSRRSGLPTSKVSDLIAAETWLDSADALQMGFVDNISQVTVSNLANYDVSGFRNAPAAYNRKRAPLASTVRLRAKYGRLFNILEV